MSPDQVAYIAEEVLKQNRSLITSMDMSGMRPFEGIVDGVKYQVGINKGRVGQLFPIVD